MLSRAGSCVGIQRHGFSIGVRTCGRTSCPGKRGGGAVPPLDGAARTAQVRTFKGP